MQTANHYASICLTKPWLNGDAGCGSVVRREPGQTDTVRCSACSHIQRPGSLVELQHSSGDSQPPHRTLANMHRGPMTGKAQQRLRALGAHVDICSMRRG